MAVSPGKHGGGRKAAPGILRGLGFAVFVNFSAGKAGTGRRAGRAVDAVQIGLAVTP